MGEPNDNPEVTSTPAPEAEVKAPETPAEKPAKAPRKAAEPKVAEKAPEVDGVVVPSDLAEQLDAAQAAGKSAFLVTPTALRVDA